MAEPKRWAEKMKTGAAVTFFDKDDASVGSFLVEAEEPIVVLGSFSPGPAYDRFRAVFEEHAALVSTISLAYIDEVEDQISAFGIYGVIDGHAFQIFDLQIHGAKASFRLRPYHPLQKEPNQPPEPMPLKRHGSS